MYHFCSLHFFEKGGLTLDKRVYLLTIVSFVVGMAELIIGGILDLVANDLNVTIGRAGLLITIFSLTFAIAAPILLIFTEKVDRKKLMLISLCVFFLSNVLAISSINFFMLFTSRILSALSGSLLAVLCMTIAPTIVTRNHTGKAIGLVIMGTSASIVLGLPIGLFLGNLLGWRAPFVLIALLTILSMFGVQKFLGHIQAQPAVSIMTQIRTLKNRKILFAQLTMFFYLTGHLTVYAFLTPFVKDILGLSSTWTMIVYFIFGIAAVTGGGLGGNLSDKFGAKHIMISVISIFAITLFILPLSPKWLPLFFVLLVIWGMMSWSITPALQTYLINIAPETSAIQQSINNSALHFGIAFGSFVGSMIVERSGVIYTPVAGGIFLLIALLAATISIKSKIQTARQIHSS